MQMTIGIGGSSAEIELARLTSVRASMKDRAVPIQMDEYLARIQKVRSLMLEAGTDALYLDATSSLRYFTGMQCHASERLHGAIITALGDLIYVCPTFEEQKTKAGMVVEGEFLLWEEHENPMAAVAETVLIRSKANPTQLAVDPQTPFFIVDGLQKTSSKLTIINADSLIWPCRQIKSQAEISLLTQAKAITLNVQQAVARILEPGIDTRDVQSFFDSAHIASGIDGRSTINIVLF
jgi:Xaa-Pro dipeptidase